jgi:hypothetical protein
MFGKQKVEDDLNPNQEDVLYTHLRHGINNMSILNDMLEAMYEMRCAAPFIVLFAMLIAYQLFIAPYRVEVERTDPTSINLVGWIHF